MQTCYVKRFAKFSFLGILDSFPHPYVCHFLSSFDLMCKERLIAVQKHEMKCRTPFSVLRQFFRPGDNMIKIHSENSLYDHLKASILKIKTVNISLQYSN